jgi:hypothetical protein
MMLLLSRPQACPQLASQGREMDLLGLFRFPLSDAILDMEGEYTNYRPFC